MTGKMLWEPQMPLCRSPVAMLSPGKLLSVAAKIAVIAESLPTMGRGPGSGQMLPSSVFGLPTVGMPQTEVLSSASVVSRMAWVRDAASGVAAVCSGSVVAGSRGPPLARSLPIASPGF
jgi:hypothetical protein